MTEQKQEQKNDQDIFDYAGNKIEVGTKVKYYDLDEPDNDHIGEVIEITDWDGDVDDDTGRSIVIPPDVRVKFGDAVTETYVTSEWEFDGYYDRETGDHEPYYAKGKVEELLVVKDS